MSEVYQDNVQVQMKYVGSNSCITIYFNGVFDMYIYLLEIKFVEIQVCSRVLGMQYH
jgi:hypothetical protein